MSGERISARYAKSLIDLAIEQNKLERVKEDVEYFFQASHVRDLQLLLRSPIIHAVTKRKIFVRLFADRFDTMTMAFLDILLRKGREPFLTEIAEAFLGQYREIKQITSVKLTTASPVSTEQLEEIRKKIRASSATFANIEIDTHVDESLLGGFVVEFGDRLYDASVEHQLEEMRKALLRNSIETLQ